MPVLEDRKEFASWHRKFLDYVSGRQLLGILKGDEPEPVPLTQDEIQAIPSASRWAAKTEQQKEVKSHQQRCEKAFSLVMKSMENQPLIYGSVQMDALRLQDQHDAAAAYAYVLVTLKPSNIDAQMTVEALITNMKIIGKEY